MIRNDKFNLTGNKLKQSQNEMYLHIVSNVQVPILEAESTADLLHFPAKRKTIVEYKM